MPQGFPGYGPACGLLELFGHLFIGRLGGCRAVPRSPVRVACVARLRQRREPGVDRRDWRPGRRPSGSADDGKRLAGRHRAAQPVPAGTIALFVEVEHPVRRARSSRCHRSARPRRRATTAAWRRERTNLTEEVRFQPPVDRQRRAGRCAAPASWSGDSSCPNSMSASGLPRASSSSRARTCSANDPQRRSIQERDRGRRRQRSEVEDGSPSNRRGSRSSHAPPPTSTRDRHRAVGRGSRECRRSPGPATACRRRRSTAAAAPRRMW